MLLAAVIVPAPGCATQSYVDESVTRLEARLDEQSESINELTETSSRERFPEASTSVKRILIFV